VDPVKDISANIVGKIIAGLMAKPPLLELITVQMEHSLDMTVQNTFITKNNENPLSIKKIFRHSNEIGG
jgi:hypothetical protein